MAGPRHCLADVPIRQPRAAGTAAALGLALAAEAHHIPVELDVAGAWTPLPGDGYLHLMAPEAPVRIVAVPGSRAIGTGAIYREEHTGFTTAGGRGVVDHPYDNDRVAGERADFDWVQEHRPDETGVTHGGTNHPRPGTLGWSIGAIARSPHLTGGKPHGHSAAESPPGALPELAGEAYAGESFNVVDVFSAIVEGEDADEGGRREAALDYELWFVDLERGLSTHGVPAVVFAPGWSEASGSDDYVVRWVPASPGTWTAVAIDPPFRHGHDKVTEIDAVRAATGLALTVSLPP